MGTFSLFLLTVFIILLIIWINSPGKPEPFRTQNSQILKSSLSEIINKEFNGAIQRLVIKSKDTLNPVLLVIHGGPGGYQLPFLYDQLGISLEDKFTVCYWDQRGSGPAYTDAIPDSTITLNQIVEDGIGVSKYLIHRFNKQKIYIEGQSWGTIVGSLMAKKSPELYHAYIGIGQVSNQLQSEILSYHYVLDEAKRRNDLRAQDELLSIGAPPYDTDEQKINAVDIQRFHLNRYSDNFPISRLDFMKTFLMNNEFTFQEKYRYFSGDLGYSFTLLWPTCVDINLINEVSNWQIPVFILQGEHDHNTATSLTKKYFDLIDAPAKQYYEFENSGHIVHWENPVRYRHIMTNDVLKISSEFVD